MLYKFRYSGWMREPSSIHYPKYSHAALNQDHHGFVYMKVDRKSIFRGKVYYKNYIYVYSSYAKTEFSLFGTDMWI